MSAPQTRRAFISIGLTGLTGLLIGCTGRSKTSKPVGGDSHDTSAPPTHTGNAGDTSASPSDSGGSSTDTAGLDTAGTDTAAPSVCSETPDNIEGPYWVRGVPVRSDLDLYGDEGVSLTISGRVTDLSCTPIPGAIVEIWQANPSGGYDNHSPERRYRGQLAADESGNYSFHTLRPGWYLNGPAYRPSHIHVKIWVDGVEKKTTQLYFEGDPHIAGDEFVVDGLIIPLLGDEATGLMGSFDFSVEI